MLTSLMVKRDKRPCEATLNLILTDSLREKELLITTTAISTKIKEIAKHLFCNIKRKA